MKSNLNFHTHFINVMHVMHFMVIQDVKFSSGVQNWKGFCLRISIPKGNYWILRIGVMGKVSKSALIWLSKSTFNVKNHQNLSQFFFTEEYQFRSNFKSFYYKNDALFLTSRNSIISFGYADSYAKIFLILYPLLENSTTRIAIT